MIEVLDVPLDLTDRLFGEDVSAVVVPEDSTPAETHHTKGRLVVKATQALSIEVIERTYPPLND